MRPTGQHLSALPAPGWPACASLWQHVCAEQCKHQAMAGWPGFNYCEITPALLVLPSVPLRPPACCGSCVLVRTEPEREFWNCLSHQQSSHTADRNKIFTRKLTVTSTIHQPVGPWIVEPTQHLWGLVVVCANESCHTLNRQERQWPPISVSSPFTDTVIGSNCQLCIVLLHQSAVTAHRCRQKTDLSVETACFPERDSFASK